MAATAAVSVGGFNEAPAERGGEPGCHRSVAARVLRFNEAPAERGGELDQDVARGAHEGASMRPPLNAGENLRRGGRGCPHFPCFNEAPAERGGERVTTPFIGDDQVTASMRPPLNAGENLLGGLEQRADPAASMRPPLNAGENASRPGGRADDARSFNEAPAERGGEQPATATRWPAYSASMRPPLNAGENVFRLRQCGHARFASMRPPLNAGENPARPPPPGGAAPCFNEAPAERGGEREQIVDAERQRVSASMRPPLNAGENRNGRRTPWRRAARFNEAPAERGGERTEPPPTMCATRLLQ